MTVKLYALTCGYLGGPFDALMEGGEGGSICPFRRS